MLSTNSFTPSGVLEPNLATTTLQTTVTLKGRIGLPGMTAGMMAGRISWLTVFALLLCTVFCHVPISASVHVLESSIQPSARVVLGLRNRAPASLLRLRGAGDADSKVQEALAAKELGNEAYKKKDFEEAIKQYERAAELDPTSMVYLNNIAAALFGQGKYEECIKKCQEAIEVGKQYRSDFKDIARAHSRCGNACAKLGRLEEAIKHYDSSLVEFKDGNVELKRREVIRQKDEIDKAAYLNPEKAEEHRQNGNAFFKEGKWVDAIREYTEGLRRDPQNHLIYSNRAQTYIKVMDFGSALKDCDKCLELKPDFPRAYARKATVQMLCKQIHKAKETVELGLSKAPEDPELKEVFRKVQQSIMGVGLSPEEREERAKEAMKDPSIQQIMSDPVMRQVLDDMQSNPTSAAKHMQDPMVKRNIDLLVAAGIIQMR
mmetsp:Transcript_42169/g.132836  ORF Transcript_42169/g.132836 Transcript_42169/m.132836 type:complete len:432 (-) Transcript_42169:279-1574(-)